MKGRVTMWLSISEEGEGRLSVNLLKVGKDLD